MNRRLWLTALVAVGLSLTGCASQQSSASKPVPASGASMAGMSMAPGAQSGSTTTGSAAAGSAGTGKPTATALMVCGDDIKAKVVQVLKLKTAPATRSTFAGGLFSCNYSLPMGTLVLSVQHSDTKAAAGGYFEASRSRLGNTQTLDGLGERAFGTGSGIAVVVKDNETLKVDATGLPAVFGAEQQRRTDLAYELASDVLGCWTGNE